LTAYTVDASSASPGPRRMGCGIPTTTHCVPFHSCLPVRTRRRYAVRRLRRWHLTASTPRRRFTLLGENPSGSTTLPRVPDAQPASPRGGRLPATTFNPPSLNAFPASKHYAFSASTGSTLGWFRQEYARVYLSRTDRRMPWRHRSRRCRAVRYLQTHRTRRTTCYLSVQEGRDGGRCPPPHAHIKKDY